jgi:transposase
MKLHANAKLGPKGRLVICRRVLEQGWSLAEAAEAAGVSDRTAGKWVRRYREEGEAGLLGRSSAPRRVANVTPPERVEAIAALRRVRLTGPEIAETLEMATSTSPRSCDASASAASRAWTRRSRSDATNAPGPAS